MAINIWDIVVDWSKVETWTSNNLLERLGIDWAISATKNHAAGALAWLSILVWGAASAEESQNTQYADAPDVILAVASGETATDALPSELDFVRNLDLKNPDVLELLEARLAGIEHFRPFLEEVSRMSETGQAWIVWAIDWIGSWSPDEPSDETIALAYDGRVPLSLIAAISEEAIANWADPEWDVEAFADVLMDIREWWSTQSWETLADMIQYSPNTTRFLPYRPAQELIASLDWLVNAQWQLVDVRWRLVNAQWQLVDARWRLIIQEGIWDELGNIWEQLN